MADSKKDKNNSDKDTISTKPVADLHVAQIIAALHQNAIAKCKGELADSFRIVNSAIEESGDKISLTSQGQHIISVVLTEEAAKKSMRVPIDKAVYVLQTYVHWFVGPDLAKKVKRKNVKPLADETEDDSKALHDYDESKMPFMKFSQFLHEEAENPESNEQQSKPEESGSEEKSSEKQDPEESKPEKPEDKKLEKASKEEDAEAKEGNKVGYYITYEMKVEGLKKVDDPRKVFRKSLMNYLGNFFDGVTIKASGIFGGGDSFSVKDMKDYLRKNFGPIDPDELVRNVRDRIEKKFKGSSPEAEVKIQDRKTLLLDLGNQINGKQKQQIEKAAYSLWIQIYEDDPKKTIFNRGVVAGIVQASIKGLFKKFRSMIGKNDVIYIENFKDIHGKTEKIRKLYNDVPTPNNIKETINRAKNANDAVSKLEKLFDKIKNSTYRSNCERASKCYMLWDKFQSEGKFKDKSDELTKISRDNKQFTDIFKPFIDKYSRVFAKTENKELDESIKIISFAVSNAEISKLLIESMFDASFSMTDEAEENSSDDSSKFNAEDAISYASHLIDDKYGKNEKDGNLFSIQCGIKQSLQKNLKLFDLPDSFLSSDYKNAIAAVPAQYASNSKMNESTSVSDDIFSILFEEDKPDGGEGGESKDKFELPDIDDGMMKQILTTALKRANAKDISEDLITASVMKLDESADSSKEDYGIDLTDVNGILRKNVAEFVANSMQDSKKKNEKVDNRDNISNNWFIGVAKSDDVKNFLKDHSLGSKADYNRLNKEFSFVFLTHLSKKGIERTDGKTYGAATKGFKYFNSGTVKSIINKSFMTNGIMTDENFDIFTVKGVPSKAKVDSSIFNGSSAKSTLTYYKSEVLPEYTVYLATFDIDEEELSPTPPSPPDPPNPGSEPSKNTKKLTTAYILEFGKEEINTVEIKTDADIDVDLDDVDNKRNDLYIIPIRWMKYEDPEYERKNLI